MSWNWKEIAMASIGALALLWLIGWLVRPRAGRIPINIVVYRLKTHWRKRYETRSLDQIDTVIIHHSATTSGSAELYARYHVENNGWPGIGYHYVIDKDGSIEQTQFLKTVSFHTSGVNTRAIGICLTGNYDVQQPPPDQLQSAVLLIRYLERKLGRTLRIQGHNEHSSKSCPGDAISIAALTSAVRNERA